MLSYFENLPNYCVGFSSNVSINASRIRFQHLVLPDDLSAKVFRIPVSLSMNSSTAGGTSANTSFSYERYRTEAMVVYSQGTGANSQSLMSMFSTSGGWTWRNHFTAGAAGDQYTVSQFMTVPGAVDAATTFSASYAVTSGTYNISTESMSNFTGIRFLDIPFATSLSVGNYWFGIGASTNTVTNAGPNFSGAGMLMSYAMISGFNVAATIGNLGEATANSNVLQPGDGFITTNAATMTTGNIPFTSVNFQVSAAQFPIQLINRA